MSSSPTSRSPLEARLLKSRAPQSPSPLSVVIRNRLTAGGRRIRLGAAAATLAAAIVVLPASMASARGPENVADVAEQVIDAVVNISTSQKVEARMGNMPDLPHDSPMEEFFEEFFKSRRGGQGGGQGGPGGPGGPGDPGQMPHRITSLGSGFIIDPSGLVVTKNLLIPDAAETK